MCPLDHGKAAQAANGHFPSAIDFGTKLGFQKAARGTGQECQQPSKELWMPYSDKNKWRNDVCRSPGSSKGWQTVMKVFHILLPLTSLGIKGAFRATTVCTP